MGKKLIRHQQENTEFEDGFRFGLEIIRFLALPRAFPMSTMLYLPETAFIDQKNIHIFIAKTWEYVINELISVLL